MKTIILIILFFIPFVGFPQEKIIYGSIMGESNDFFNKIKNDPIFELLKKCKIYLSKDSIKLTKKIYYSKSGYFNFTISERQQKKYEYLIISNKHYENIFLKISDLSKDSNNIKFYSNNLKPILVGKPAIYLYSDTLQKTTVKLDFKGKLGTTFPKYENEWQIITNKDGIIINEKDNKKYRYLFWEGTYTFPISHSNYKTGFIVKKDDLVNFFSEKLEAIGLNEEEINDFIVYWLPILDKNEYNFIHFWINDNIDNSAFLEITPKPDTEIRVFMEFKEADTNFKIEEQEITKTERKGFTVVEWGGGEIENNLIE